MVSLLPRLFERLGCALKTVRSLPETAKCHWERRVWDRWYVEDNEGGNRPVHRRQRLNTIRVVSELPHREMRVLDLGCGTGKVSLGLVELENVRKVIGLDINKTALKMSLSRLYPFIHADRFQAVNADIGDCEKNLELGRFEVVVCLDVLHHLHNIEDVLTCVANMMDQQSVFIGNFLSKERSVYHLARKSGIFGLVIRALPGLFFWLPCLPDSWKKTAAKKGYYNIALLTGDQVKELLAENFTITKFESGDYHWFVCKKNRSSA